MRQQAAGGFTIEIRNLQRKHRIDQGLIRDKSKAILSLCGLKDAELSILIVNNQRIRMLNKKYRGIDRPTDVLSFPMMGTEMKNTVASCMGSKQSPRHSCGSRSPDHCKTLDSHFRGNDRKKTSNKLQEISKVNSVPAAQPGGMSAQPLLLGDVVLSMEKIESQAREQGHSPDCELMALLTHGILHLIGYDHERSLQEDRRMRKKEGIILAKL